MRKIDTKGIRRKPKGQTVIGDCDRILAKIGMNEYVFYLAVFFEKFFLFDRNFLLLCTESMFYKDYCRGKKRDWMVFNNLIDDKMITKEAKMIKGNMVAFTWLGYDVFDEEGELVKSYKTITGCFNHFSEKFPELTMEKLIENCEHHTEFRIGDYTFRPTYDLDDITEVIDDDEE